MSQRELGFHAVPRGPSKRSRDNRDISKKERKVQQAAQAVKPLFANTFVICPACGREFFWSVWNLQKVQDEGRREVCSKQCARPVNEGGND